MHRRSFHRLTFLSLVAFALLLPGVALAQTQDYSVLIDSDNSDATGCTVGSPPEAFLGASYRVVTTVDTSVDPPVVTNIALEVCTAPPSTWAPFAGPDPFTAFPTPFPAPTDGIYDAIESYVPLNLVAQNDVIQLGFFTGSLADPQDVLFTTNGAAGGPAIEFGVPFVEIPTLAEWSMLLLSLLLLAAGIVALRHRPSRAAFMLGLLLISGGLGIAIASNPHAADGNLLDWTGHAAIANDQVPPDAPPNSDIFRAFAHVEGDNIFFRVDADITPDAPFAEDDAFTVERGLRREPARRPGQRPGPATAGPGDRLRDPARQRTVAITNGGADADLHARRRTTATTRPERRSTPSPTDRPHPPGRRISTATVTVTVTCVDDRRPRWTTPPRSPRTPPRPPIDVLANDTDTDGGPKTIASVTQPANGTVVITGGGAGLTYQPDADYCNTPARHRRPTPSPTRSTPGGSTPRR